jgi:hypothetical protein
MIATAVSRLAIGNRIPEFYRSPHTAGCTHRLRALPACSSVGFCGKPATPGETANGRARARSPASVTAKTFLAYARQAIELAGAETVAGHNLDNDWQAMIRGIASWGQVSMKKKWRQAAFNSMRCRRVTISRN